MTDPQMQRTLLEEIDVRQEEVLQQLDQLNARVEALLNECLSSRTADNPATDRADLQ